MGKTTLLQALRHELDSTTAVAYVSNSMLPFPGILEYMLEEFEIQKPGESHAQRLVVLQNFLLERHRTGQSTVLILDEAQNLYPQTLEQIRLLSNFETTKEKILQIVLVGQPELLARLELPELRQLKQRIGILCTIPAMTSSATRNYIRTRLRLAGARDLGIFTEEALARDLVAGGRDPPRGEHGLRSLPADRLRRPDAANRRRHRGPGAVLSARRRADALAAPGTRARPPAPGPPGPGDARSPRRASPAAGPAAA